MNLILRRPPSPILSQFSIWNDLRLLILLVTRTVLTHLRFPASFGCNVAAVSFVPAPADAHELEKAFAVLPFKTTVVAATEFGGNLVAHVVGRFTV